MPMLRSFSGTGAPTCRACSSRALAPPCSGQVPARVVALWAHSGTSPGLPSEHSRGSHQIPACQASASLAVPPLHSRDAASARAALPTLPAESVAQRADRRVSVSAAGELGLRTDFHAHFNLSTSQPLGQGQFGVVYRAQHVSSARQVAVKVIPKDRADRSRAEHLDAIQREISLWQSLQRCRHVVRVEGVYEDTECVYLVQTLARGGDLRAVLERGTPLTEREAATVMRSVLEVIVTCHAHDHIHGDCKPANFLLLNPHRSTGCQEFPSTQQTPEPEGPATLSDYHAQHSGSSCDDIDPSAHACPIPIPTSPSPPPPPPQPGRSHTPQPASDTTLQHLHASYQLPAAAGAGAADPSALAQPCDILTKWCGGSSDGGPGSTKTSTTASSSTAQDSSSGSTDSTTSSTAQDSSTSSTAQDSSSGSTDSGTGMSGGVSSTAAHGDSSTDNTSVSRRGGTAVNGVGSATAHGISGASTEPAVSGDSSRCTSAAGMSDESSSSDMPLLPDWLRVLTEAKYIPTQDLMAAYQAMASDDESVVGGVAGGVVGGVAGGQWFATCGWGCGEEMVVLATDFGCAQPLHPVHRKGVLRKRRIGSPVYMAPEMWQNGAHVGPAVDVWAAGVMLYQLISGRYPFWCLPPRQVDSMMPYQIVCGIQSNPIDWNSEPWGGVSPQCKNLLTAMLTRDPEERISADAALQHPWFSTQLAKPR